MCIAEIKRSTKQGKKFMAIFTNCTTGDVKTIHFGAAGMSDFTKHHDIARRERYFNRHRANENWENPFTAGSLSRYILWNKQTIEQSVKDYASHFNFDKVILRLDGKIIVF
jgi:hypothetical protein